MEENNTFNNMQENDNNDSGVQENAENFSSELNSNDTTEQTSYEEKPTSAEEVGSTSNEQTDQNSDDPMEEKRNKVFSEEGVDLSGLKESVLKPQSEREKRDIERAMEKERKKRNGEPAGLDLPMDLIKKVSLGVLAAILIIFLGVKVVNNISSASPDSAIMEQDVFVYQDDIRLKVKTSADINKSTVMIFKGEKKITQEAGAVVSTDAEDGSKYWEFSVENLAKGTYEYKCYAKNTEKENSLAVVKGEFNIK